MVDSMEGVQDGLWGYSSHADGGFVTGADPERVLSFVGAQTIIEQRLRGAATPLTVRTLAQLAGFSSGGLDRLLTATIDAGCLESVNGRWQLVAEPVRAAIIPIVRARLSRVPLDRAAALFRIALGEGAVAGADLSASDRAVVDELLLDEVVEYGLDGTVRFRAPGAAEALRRLSPPREQERWFRAALAAGRLTLPALRWAAGAGEPVPVQLLTALVAESLEAHEWQGVIEAVELSEEVPLVTAPDSARPTGGAADAPPETRAAVHVDAAYAARFVPDAGLAHALLDRAEELSAGAARLRAPGAARGSLGIATRIAITRAELQHYHDGDLDAALCTLAGGASEPLDAAARAAHRVLHLVYGGRSREARDEIAEHRHLLRRCPRLLRARVAAAEALVRVALGAPQRALRRISMQAAQQAAYVAAALGSNGPAKLPTLAKRLADRGEDLYRPDLVTFYLARASWELAGGTVGEAHRLGSTALDATEMLDPSGMAAALIALVAETSALRGDRARAAQLDERFAAVEMRSSAVLSGTLSAHLGAARLLVGAPRADERLREDADRFISRGQFGFAAEALYCGVRFGGRRAARSLLEIAAHLDGDLHAMRVAHASALLSDDPVALMAVSDRLHGAGLRLFAAEAAVAASSPSAPAAVLRRARARVAELIAEQGLQGDALLQRVAGVPHDIELTAREREVSGLIAEGLTNAEIAERLGLSLRTVEGHISRLYRKTGETRRAPARVADGSSR